ncbi:unnamed protein product [Clavelina lepadiformis]|uniref:Uncharacterized protein n=1 Tax=Clavelina lepadiformis TaxID=159417 RepID=A0ABP0FRG7_CLALP
MRPVKVRKSAAISPAAAESARATRQALPFASRRFHVLFNSLFKVLFNFPSRYLFAIGLATVFSLRWSLPPALGCIPKQPDSEKTPSTHANRRHGPDTRYGTKPRSEGRGRSATRARRILYATIPERSKSDRIRRWAHPASLARVVSSDLRPKCKRRHTCRGSTTFAIDRGDLAKRGHLFEVDPPPPRSPIACRTLADFDGTAETQLRPSSTREPSDPPPRAIIVYRFSFYEAVATGLILSAERTISRPSLETARVLDARERLVPCRAPQRARLDLDKRERRPIVFSDTGPAVASRSGSNRRTSLNHSIGSSDGRKPESRSLSELTRQIAPPTKNGHAPPPTESRKSSQSVNPHCVRAGFATILPPEPKDFGFPKAAGEVVKVTPPDR